MADILRRFKPEAFVTDVALGSQQILTPGIFFDNSIEVISGYQSFITLAPTLERYRAFVLRSDLLAKWQSDKDILLCPKASDNKSEMTE